MFTLGKIVSITQGPPMGAQARILSVLPAEPIKVREIINCKKLDAAQLRETSSAFTREANIRPLEMSHKKVGYYDGSRPIPAYTQSAQKVTPLLPSRPPVPNRPGSTTSSGCDIGNPYVDHNPFGPPISNNKKNQFINQPSSQILERSNSNNFRGMTKSGSAGLSNDVSQNYGGVGSQNDGNTLHSSVPSGPVSSQIKDTSQNSSSSFIIDRLAEVAKSKKRPPPPPVGRNPLSLSSSPSIQETAPVISIAKRFEQLGIESTRTVPFARQTPEPSIIPTQDSSGAHHIFEKLGISQIHPSTATRKVPPPVPANRPIPPSFGSENSGLANSLAVFEKLGKSDTSIPKINNAEFKERMDRYNKLFVQYDKWNTGRLSGILIRSIWTRSQLDPKTLGTLWYLF
jgi:hypothetical protein